VTEVRALFLGAASAAAGLLAAPEVAEAWDAPSALEKLSVRGLAGHLAAQIQFVSDALEGPEASEEPIGVREYYARAVWIGADLDDDFNTGIRAKGEKDASDGPRALAESAAAAVTRLRDALPAAPPRRVRRAGWPFSLTLDDFVTTRLLETTVHSDDLAHSVGVATPELPAEAVETVVDVLSRIALRRHGAVNVLRALSRAERAPASIAAL
jgi:mycothiol maleylpyruvate isomerase-like protein